MITGISVCKIFWAIHLSPFPAGSEPSTRKSIKSASGTATFASSRRNSPNLFNGLCTPGVSINTICPSFVV